MCWNNATPQNYASFPLLSQVWRSKCLVAIGVQTMHPLWLNTWLLPMLLVVISQNDNQLAKDSDMFVILISKSIFKKFLQSQLILQLIANYVTSNMHIITDMCPSISDFHLSVTYSLLGVGWGAGMAHWWDCSLSINVSWVQFKNCVICGFIVLLVLALLL